MSGVNLTGRYYLAVCDPLASDMRATVFTYIVALNDTVHCSETAALCAARCSFHQDSFNLLAPEFDI
jgi:hypothetical protein